MIQEKDFVKCGSPYTPYELHVSHAGMEGLIRRDILLDKILEAVNDPSLVALQVYSVVDRLVKEKK